MGLDGGFAVQSHTAKVFLHNLSPPVLCILFASGHFDTKARLTDADTGEPAATLEGHTGGVNAVAIYGVAGARPVLDGMIPTAWYPSTIDVSPDGKYLAVGSLFGLGSGEGTLHNQRARYVFATRGSVHVIPIPTAAELTGYTTAVSQNNRLVLASAP